jgi:hypothetical protein
MGDLSEVKSDLVQMVRLALSEQTQDVRLFAARLVRKYRGSDLDLAEKIDSFLRTKPATAGVTYRKAVAPPPAEIPLPQDDESRLSLLKVFKDSNDREAPLLSAKLEEPLRQLIEERRQSARLMSMGLTPSRSSIFVGKPGVGKTLTARWLAAQLDVPLYILDLTAVMSSLLGRSGSNLRAALDFAKRTPCVLLLDEIDAIAKRRSDEADVGELKRLVTVILQEVDEWPATGLLLAATNHPELIDPALWRRFDLIVEFDLPDPEAVKNAIARFLGPDVDLFETWIEILSVVLKGESFSDIEREIQRLRRAVALGIAPDSVSVEQLVKARAMALDRQSRIEIAVLLAGQGQFSQHRISDLTGVSRDTIRKYTSDATVADKKTTKRGT